MNTILTKSTENINTKPLRRRAAFAGVLYIIGTVAGMCSAIVMPYFDTPDYLMKVSGNATPVILGALFLLTMGLALAMMSVLLYPVRACSPVDLRLGARFRPALSCIRSAGVVRSRRQRFNCGARSDSVDACARNGSGGVADCERIQSKCSLRFV